MTIRKRIAFAAAVTALGTGLAVAPAAHAASTHSVQQAAVKASCNHYSGTALTKAGQTGSAAAKRIREVQCLININTSYPTVLEVDGKFGTKTYNAVVSVQKHAFPNDSSQWDGQVGTKTWAKLRSGVWW
ncbi:peptidoglycan-binding protein [Streptomyces sp. NPDC052693]|uniref:peptidoglycan-binding domain-containing protein n=1 Tax=Streptomyces sp. NPDC052693 TaxID=3155814 RepID=UPI00342C6D33